MVKTNGENKWVMKTNGSHENKCENKWVEPNTVRHAVLVGIVWAWWSRAGNASCRPRWYVATTKRWSKVMVLLGF